MHASQSIGNSQDVGQLAKRPSGKSKIVLWDELKIACAPLLISTAEVFTVLTHHSNNPSPNTPLRPPPPNPPNTHPTQPPRPTHLPLQRRLPRLTTNNPPNNHRPNRPPLLRPNPTYLPHLSRKQRRRPLRLLRQRLRHEPRVPHLLLVAAPPRLARHPKHRRRCRARCLWPLESAR